MKKKHQNIEVNLSGIVKEQTQILGQSKENSYSEHQLNRSMTIEEKLVEFSNNITTPVGLGVLETTFLIEKTTEIQRCFHSAGLTETSFCNYLQLVSDSLTTISDNLRRIGQLTKDFYYDNCDKK